VILGDIQQIDTPYLNEVTSGFTYVIDRFKHCPYSAHITLTRGERSRLAEYAATSL
jgi:PhoH-like ATPase